MSRQKRSVRKIGEPKNSYWLYRKVMSCQAKPSTHGAVNEACSPTISPAGKRPFAALKKPPQQVFLTIVNCAASKMKTSNSNASWHAKKKPWRRRQHC